DDGERGEAAAVLLEPVHLRDLLVERAAGERDAERVHLEPAFRLALLLRKAFGAEIAVVVVAVDAVVDLMHRCTRRHARVREPEAVAAAERRGRALQPAGLVAGHRYGGHEPRRVD